MGRFKALGTLLNTGVDFSKKKADDALSSIKNLNKKTISNAGVGKQSNVFTKTSPNVREVTKTTKLSKQSQKKLQNLKIQAKEDNFKAVSKLKKAGVYGAIGTGTIGIGKLGYDAYLDYKFPEIAVEERQNENNEDRLENEANENNILRERLEILREFGSNPMDFSDAFGDITNPNNNQELEDEKGGISPLVLAGGAVAAFVGYKYLKKKK